MKKVAPRFLLIGLVFLLVSLSPAKNVKKYTSEDGKMSVVFPIEYGVKTKSEDKYRSTKISCTQDDVFYFVNHTLHEEEMTDPVALSQTSLDAFNASVGGEIKNSSEWKIKKYKGLQAKIVLEEQDVLLEYRVMIVGQIQYQFSIGSPTSSWNEAKAQAFFKSIKLKK